MRWLLFGVMLVPVTVDAAPVRDADQAARYDACLGLIETNPEQAIDRATQWRGQANGGVPARHCLALALAAKGNYAEAATALEATARAAEAEHDPNVADLWGQAGNAALLSGKPAVAAGYLTSGIAASGAASGRTAALLADRARASVELDKLADARADLDRATRLDPQAPVGWLLRATLARREHDLPAAERAILEAGHHAPGDPDIGLEAGNIAAAQGRTALAHRAWHAVVTGAPGSPAAAAAAKLLAANPAGLYD